MLKAVAALCAVTALLYGTPTKIGSIHVKGLGRLPEAQVIAALGLKPGQTVEDAQYEAALEKLLQSGVFSTAGFRYEPRPDGQTVSVTFEVAEVEQVYDYKFEELPLPDSQLLAVLRRDPFFHPKITGSDVVLNRYAKMLTEALGGRVTVVARVMGDRPGEPYILFRPNTPRANVAEVTFVGNNAVPIYELQNKMAAISVGQPFTEESFREQLQTQIKPMYEVRGLLRADFPKITVEKAKDVDGLHVTVEVVEGEPYKLADVRVVGAEEELLAEGEFKKGEIADFGRISAGVSNMRQALRRRGYMRAQTAMKRKLDDAKKTVVLFVEVTPGPLYQFSGLTIRGLDITTEPHIRKLWGINEGDPYRDGYATRVIDRIKEDGLLDGLGEIGQRVEIDDNAHTVQVTLDFKGTPKQEQKKRKPF